jgi:hypothetical protein
MKVPLLSGSLLLVLLLSTCDKPFVIKSAWTGSEIACDNDTIQWNGAMQATADPQFSIGIRNDARFLYLRMVSWKRVVNKQILHFGSTTWFTSPSKKGKRFGLHFPLGMRNNAALSHAELEAEGSAEDRKARIEESLQELEMLGPGKDDSLPVKTKVAESFGIVVRMFPTEENLVYEIKIPLHRDSATTYAVDIGKDSVMSVTFESDDSDQSGRGQGQRHDDLPGMGGGGAGVGGGRGTHGGGNGLRHGGGAGAGGEGQQRSFREGAGEQFKTSLILRLAGKPEK